MNGKNTKIEKALLVMEELLLALVKNSEELRELSKSTTDPKGFEALQGIQEALVAEIMAADGNLTEASDGDEEFKQSKEWKRVDQLLEKFQELNNEFLENLKVRQGLIAFELKDVRKSKQMLLEMQQSYAIPKKTGNQAAPGKRINTTL